MNIATPVVEFRSIADLVPYARNARTHTPAQVRQLAASVDRFGFTNPVLVDEDGGIIAGHGRVLGASNLYGEGKRLRLASGDELPDGMVPVITARGWSDTAKRAYVLADNQIALNAGWDKKLLGEELSALKLSGFDLDLTGFGSGELERLLGGGRRADEDEVPEVQALVVTQPGDAWLLGEHRLVCGDSTDPAAVKAALCGARPHLMVTDPPYGVEYKPDWRNQVVRANGSAVAARATGEVLNDHRADWREAWALFQGDVAYVYHAGIYAGAVADSLVAAGFELRSQIIWDKTRLVIGRGDYHWQHEPCWYAVRKGRKGHWASDRSQTTVWQIPHTRSETGHGTQKPVECMRRPMLNNSVEGDFIYEPFSGSGTTIIAGETCGRVVHAIELNPAYVDVAVRRWQQLTGRDAVRAAGGAKFNDCTPQPAGGARSDE